MHCKVAVIDGNWATIGSFNNNTFNTLQAREAHIVKLCKAFTNKLCTDIYRSIR